jgi:hypothetical protein
MPSFRISKLVVLMLLAAAHAAAAQDAPLPKFKDFPVKTIFKGKPAKPRLSGEFKRYYGHAYTSAAEEGVKFAGHYTIVERTCGSTCRIIDILDLKTGNTVKFDFASISGWRDYHDDFEPVEVKPDSRLIVFAGARNEKAPNGYHYYVLEQGRLKFLRTVETGGLFTEPLSKE